MRLTPARRSAATLVLCALVAGCGSQEGGAEPVRDVVLTPTIGPIEGAEPPQVEPASHQVVLGSDESAFAVRGAMRIERRGPFDSTLLGIGKEWYGDVVVMTGSQFGPFEVRTRVLEAAPRVGRGWEDVDEVSLEVNEGGIVATELVNNDPTAAFIDVPGSYRVRISARDRMSDDERLRQGLVVVDDDETPVETYLLEAWPAPPAAPEVLRETSAYAAETRRGPEPEPDIEGQVAGLAGAAAIGRDADDLPGARDLSGDLGTLVVSRTFPTTPDDLYDYLRFGPTLSRHVPSWTFMAGAAVSDPGLPGYSGASEGHPDQLSGSIGVIRTTITDEDQPVRREQQWAWMVPPADGSRLIEDRVVLADTRVTTTYSPTTGADGAPSTTVTVRHDDVPVEWVADLRAWWRYQLAFMEWYAERY